MRSSGPGQGQGEGHIALTVRPKSGLPTGTEIYKVASIQFGGTAPVATNQHGPTDPTIDLEKTALAFNTIEAELPTSAVVALPALATNQSFEVTWSGTDTNSGIASYDIFVSTDGGPWNAWLSNIPKTNAMFTGQPGHRYAFYSIALDNAGNRELPPQPQILRSPFLLVE